MLQEVNLLTLLPLPKKKRLGLQTIAVLYGALVVFLIINFVHHFIEKQHLEDQLAQLNLQLAAEQKHLQAVMTQYPLVNPKDLAGSTQRLRSDVITKTNLMYALTGPAQFSSYLTGFAEASIPGAWLTNIHISDEGRHIILQGDAQHAQDVQQFIMNLKRQAIFKNYAFEVEGLSQESVSEGAPVFSHFEIKAQLES